MSILSAGGVLKQFCQFCCPTRSCQPEKTQSTRSQMIVASGFWLSVWKLLPFCETKGRGQGVWPELWSLISRPPWGLGWMPCLMSRKSFWKSKNLNRSKRKQIWRRLQTKCPCSWRRKLVNLHLAENLINKGKEPTLADLPASARIEIEEVSRANYGICSRCRWSSGCLACSVRHAQRYHLNKLRASLGLAPLKVLPDQDWIWICWRSWPQSEFHSVDFVWPQWSRIWAFCAWKICVLHCKCTDWHCNCTDWHCTATVLTSTALQLYWLALHCNCTDKHCTATVLTGTALTSTALQLYWQSTALQLYWQALHWHCNSEFVCCLIHFSGLIVLQRWSVIADLVAAAVLAADLVAAAVFLQRVWWQLLCLHPWVWWQLLWWNSKICFTCSYTDSVLFPGKNAFCSRVCCSEHSARESFSVTKQTSRNFSATEHSAREFFATEHSGRGACMYGSIHT